MRGNPILFVGAMSLSLSDHLPRRLPKTSGRAQVVADGCPICGAPASFRPRQTPWLAASSGLTCFAYSGPTTLSAAFATYFLSGVTSINRFNLPAGNYSSWFRAALARLVSVASADVTCVNGPAGSNVFVSGIAAGATAPVTARRPSR